MRTTRLLAGGLLALGLAAAASPASAHAGEDHRLRFPLVCGDTTYQATTVPGRGDFTPVHLEGGGTFTPTAFTGFVGEVYDADGNLLERFEDEGTFSKGSSSKQPGSVDCTYSFTEVDEDGTRFVGTGTVTGAVNRR